MRTELDPDRLPLTLLELFRIKQGEMVSALMHVGTRLGLWEALLHVHIANSMWILFPLLGLYVSVRLVLDGNYGVLGH